MFDWDSRARHGYEVDAEDLGAPLVPSEDDACVGRNGLRDSETSGKKTSNPPVSQDSTSQLLTSSASFLAPPATDLTKLAYNSTVVGLCTPDVPHTATHVAPVSNSPSEPEHGVQHNLPLHDVDDPYGDKTSVVAQLESPDPGLPCDSIDLAACTPVLAETGPQVHGPRTPQSENVLPAAVALGTIEATCSSSLASLAAQAVWCHAASSVPSTVSNAPSIVAQTLSASSYASPASCDVAIAAAPAVTCTAPATEAGTNSCVNGCNGCA